MKVILVNGSPHKEGCTYTALTEVEKELKAEGIETEIFQIGNRTDPQTGFLAADRAGAGRKLLQYLVQFQLQ